MIILYEKDTTSFDNNGICILDPVRCEVHEVAGGQYELELHHPYDQYGKYSMLMEERLIKAPVPPVYIPETVMPQLDVIKTTEEATIYSKIPVTKYNNPNWKIIQNVRLHQQAYTYRSNAYYNAGAVVCSSDRVYRAKTGINGVAPGIASVWEYLGSLSDANSVIDGGSIVAVLPANTNVYKVADASGGYMRVRTTDNKVGFISSSLCTTTTEHYQETIPAQTIKDQIFRIYDISSDDETGLLVIRARHISYDFRRNGLYECKVTNVTPAQAIVAIQGALILDDERRIACNITTGEITQDWSFKNPINAILDPENGLANAIKARVIRNNRNFFLLDDSTPNVGVTLEYGVNLVGVRWNKNVDNPVTRLIPRAGNSENGYIFISNGGRIANGAVQNQGKNYVESEIADSYASPIVDFLNCSYTIGQEYEQPDGTKVTYTEEMINAKMLQDALEKFTKNHIDGANITLDVEFVLLGDTEEYKQYRGLQKVNLYDQITVKTGRSGIVATARVTEYVWDCLLKRYKSIKVGVVNSFNKRVPGYRMVNESVTYEKLAPDVINRIITLNASASTNTSGGGSSTGGDAEPLVTGVIDALTSTSTTDALSANQGKVLNDSLRKITRGDASWESGKDLNNYTTTGIYAMSSSLTNAPTGWGILFVIAVRSDTIEQLFFANATLYYREKKGTTWSTWATL